MVPIQRIVDRDDRLRTARVTLASGAPEQLAVDARGIMELRQDHMQPASRRDARSKVNVRPSTTCFRRSSIRPPP